MRAAGRIGRFHPSHTCRRRGVTVSSQQGAAFLTPPTPWAGRPPQRVAVRGPPAAFTTFLVDHLLGMLFVQHPISSLFNPSNRL